MNETRDLLERVGERFSFPDDAFGLLQRRRNRLQRNRRITAAGLALILTAIGIGIAVRFAALDRGVPAQPTDVRNGDLAFVGDGNLHLVDPSTGQTRILVRACPAIGNCAARIVSVDWSPDGTRIAYAKETEVVGDDAAGIYVLDTESGETARLTSCSDPCWSQTELDWSPDGTRIAYTQHAGGMCTSAASFDGRCGIFIADVDGSAPVQLRTGFLTDPVDPSWSPDGLEIAFSARGVGSVTTRRQPAEWTVYRMGTDGSGPVPLTTSDRFLAAPPAPAWSPDGSVIAFVITDAPSYYSQLWTMAPDGSDLTFVADLGCCGQGGGLDNDPSPEWSPDGTRIAVTVESSYLGILDRDGNEVAELGEAWWAYPSWRAIS